MTEPLPRTDALPIGAAPAQAAAPPPDPATMAAILFVLFSEDDAAALLSRLDPVEVRALGASIHGLGDTDDGAVHAALDGFVATARATSMLTHGAPERLAGAMTRALGPTRTQAILSEVAPRTTAAKGLEVLDWMPLADLIALVEGEPLQLVALVAAHVAPDVAAAIVQSLPEADQDDVVYRIATLGPVTTDALAAVEAMIARKDAAQPAGEVAARRGGVGDAAAILNRIRKADERRILRALNKRDKDLARGIEADMFTFADLGQLDARALGTLLRAVDNVLLVPALKGADAALRDKFLACLSQRAAQTIEDEMADRGPMPLAEVQEAQRAVVAVARRLADEGTLSIGSKDEEYV